MTALSPRIGIIGTGAIGGFYGLMLARAASMCISCCAANTQRSVSVACASTAACMAPCT